MSWRRWVDTSIGGGGGLRSAAPAVAVWRSAGGGRSGAAPVANPAEPGLPCGMRHTPLEAFRRCKVRYLLDTLARDRNGLVVWGAGPIRKAFAREVKSKAGPSRASSIWIREDRSVHSRGLPSFPPLRSIASGFLLGGGCRPGGRPVSDPGRTRVGGSEGGHPTSLLWRRIPPAALTNGSQSGSY